MVQQRLAEGLAGLLRMDQTAQVNHRLAFGIHRPVTVLTPGGGLQRSAQHVQIGFKQQRTVVQHHALMDMLGIAGYLPAAHQQAITAVEFGGDT